MPASSRPPPRLFVTADLDSGACVALTDAQAHYLTGVLRRAPGDAVTLFNGRDGEWRATLATLGRQAVAEAREQLRGQRPGSEVWLVFAALKREATEWVVQKATELGAAVLIPVVTARTGPSRPNLGRLTAIAAEAAEQSERLDVPTIRPLRPLEAVLRDWPQDRPLAAALERADAPGLARDARGLLVGPEGGFAPDELDVLWACPFIVPVSLGPRILRAETAAVAGLALLLAHPDA